MSKALPAGSSICECAGCGLRFGSVTAFDQHRTGDYEQDGKPHTRRCLTVEEMTESGMALTSRGTWSTRGAMARFAKRFGEIAS